jgi:hypothetical protein
MKHFYINLFFALNSLLLFSQNAQRTSIGVSGNSIQVVSNQTTYYVSQSVGQTGVIGNTLKNNSIRQGFQQPPLMATLLQHEINSLKVLVFPNPAKQNISIVLQEKDITNVYIQIIDSQGKLLYDGDKKYQEIINLEISDLASGIYQIYLNANGKTNTVKLIKS